MSVIRVSKKYTMSKAEADNTLKNVLDACENSDNPHNSTVSTNTVNPIKNINLLYICVICAIAITLVLPIFFAFSAQSSHPQTSKADIEVEDYYVEDSTLFIYLDGSFIDYSSIYAVNPSGTCFTPSSFDYKTGLITFDYDETEWNIYVSDLNGINLHMLFTPPQ